MKKAIVISAIKKNNYDIVNEFLKHNDIHKPLFDGLSFILLAMDYDNLPLLKYLVENGYDITYCDDDCYSPIEFATLCNALPIIRYLVELNPKISRNDSALILASSKGYMDIVIFLLDNGWDINQLDYNNSNSLHWVAQEGYFDIAKLLVNKGCNLNHKDEDGQTPLYVAASENRIEFVQLFIENGAAIDLTDNTTPFQIACAWNCYDVADILYKAGAQVNYADSDGRTALFYATVKQNKKLISYLLSIGASEDIIDNEGIHLKDLSNDEIRKKLYDELY